VGGNVKPVAGVGAPAVGKDGSESQEIIKFMQNEINNYASKNNELTKQNAEFLKKIDYLESCLRSSKPGSLPIKFNNSTISNKVITLEIIGGKIHIPVQKQVEEIKEKAQPAQKSIFPPIPGVQPANAATTKLVIQAPQPNIVPAPTSIPSKPENLSLFKECIMSSGGMLYEDPELQISLVRSIDQPTKTATFKLNFFNKTTNQPLVVNKFDPISYNKAGIF